MQKSHVLVIQELFNPFPQQETMATTGFGIVTLQEKLCQPQRIDALGPILTSSNLPYFPSCLCSVKCKFISTNICDRMQALKKTCQL